MIGDDEKGLLEVQDSGRAQKPIEIPGGRLLNRSILVARSVRGRPGRAMEVRVGASF